MPTPFRFLSVALLALVPSVAFATPILQLDIEGGTYIGGSEESVMTNAKSFTLRLLLTPNNNNSLADLLAKDYFLSIAVIPQATLGADYGSFELSGATAGAMTIDVTEGMIFGTPPMAEVQSDLGGHDIYPTYYKEVGVDFDNAFQVETYNVENTAGGDFTVGTGTYVTEIELDFTGIIGDLDFHFDLYNVVTNPNNNKLVIDNFAPFSHDAETDFNNVNLPPEPPNPVPEPGSLAIWGLGLVVAGVARHRRRRQAA